MRRVLRPVAHDVGDPVLSVAGRVAIGHPQAAQHNEVVGANTLFDWGILGIGVNASLGEAFPQPRQSGHMIPMGMSDENVFDLELMFIDVSEDGGRIETRVEDGRLASDFVPNQVGINGHAIFLSGDHPQLAPTAGDHGLGKPAFGNSLELNPIEQEFGSEFGEAAASGRLSCFFHALIRRHSQPSRLRCDHWLSMGGCTSLT